MMKSEFVERTGFEPTAEEYKEIEVEYIGTDIDKDTFCKQWKKNGGFERLMRIRASRIEELEDEVQRLRRKTASEEDNRCEIASHFNDIMNDYQKLLGMVDTKDKEIKELTVNLEDLKKRWFNESQRADEAERKVNVLKEAFSILKGGE